MPTPTILGASPHLRYGLQMLGNTTVGWSDEAGGGRVPEWVEVGCYAGGRGDETPRVVLLGGREVMLRVERRWIEEPVGSTGGERRRMFQVQLEDGRAAAWRRSRMVRGPLRTRQTVVNDRGRVEPPRVYRSLGMPLVVWSREAGLPHATVVGWRVSNSIGLSMPRELWRRWRLWKISR